MDDLIVFAGIAAVAVIIIATVSLTIFAVTRHSAIYKKFKKPVKTTGIVDDVEFAEARDCDGIGYDYYVITYSYTDNIGVRHTAQFHWQRKLFKAGDKIALHYDSQAPENCVADCQLEYSRSAWWKALLVLAAIIGIPFVAAFIFGKK